MKTELINKLVQEATVSIDSHKSAAHIDINALVKLFVDECVGQCWSVSESEHKGYVVSECSKRISKHFGVEW
jgi:hypothetical protein